MQRLFNKLIPFLLAGIAIVAFAFGIMLLAYLFLFGALVGLVLFLISWVRYTFFASKTVARTRPAPKPGRTIDSDDWKEL